MKNYFNSILINKKNLLLNLIETIIIMFLVIGINIWFNACSIKEDGTYMNCHNAEIVIKALSYLLFSLSIINLLLLNNGVKIGIYISNIGISIIMMLIPKTLISLCMMEQMVCNKYMRPYTIVFGIVIIVFSVFEIFYNCLILRKKENNVYIN